MASSLAVGCAGPSEYIFVRAQREKLVQPHGFARVCPVSLHVAEDGALPFLAFLPLGPRLTGRPCKFRFIPRPSGRPTDLGACAGASAVLF